MKNTVLLLCLLVGTTALGQYNVSDKYLDSLKQALAKNPVDTVKFELNMLMGIGNQFVHPNEAVYRFNEAIKIATKLNDRPKMMGAYITLAYLYGHIGEPAKALEINQEVLRFVEKIGDDTSMALAFISENYEAQGDLSNALKYASKSFAVFEKRRKDKLLVDERGYPAGPLKMGNLFEKIGRLDSAMYYAKMSYKRLLEKPIDGQSAPYFYCQVCNLLGTIYSRLNQHEEALHFYRLALSKAIEVNFIKSIQQSQSALAKFFFKTNQPDSTIHYAIQAYQKAVNLKDFEIMKESAVILRQAYEVQGNYAKALYYNDLAIAARDSVTGADKVRQVQRLTFVEEQRQQKIAQEIEAGKVAYQNKVKVYSLLAVLTGLLAIALILYHNNRQKQKANAVLEKTLFTLKTTQNQLIQKEKLASLGELTAGIAHEIQNPLNFVNNFSEMSVELIEEIKQEREGRSEQRDESLIDELLADLSQNQAKINHHGKRASSIVSGMLEHSRTSTGERMMTDLNKLADEYLRLSYHGMRAKYKDFNADYELISDDNLPLINVVPQDMGRVLLNLINNAFYACTEQRRSATNVGEAKPAVELLTDVKKVIVRTECINNELIIKVIDNGTGITDEVKSKIFQPFFTTKPTGEGTGLGLSLSYDIVTKGHGGTIEVESKEGEGTTFIVKLPYQ